MDPETPARTVILLGYVLMGTTAGGVGWHELSRGNRVAGWTAIAIATFMVYQLFATLSAFGVTFDPILPYG